MAALRIATRHGDRLRKETDTTAPCKLDPYTPPSYHSIPDIQLLQYYMSSESSVAKFAACRAIVEQGTRTNIQAIVPSYLGNFIAPRVRSPQYNVRKLCATKYLRETPYGDAGTKPFADPGGSCDDGRQTGGSVPVTWGVVHLGEGPVGEPLETLDPHCWRPNNDVVPSDKTSYFLRLKSATSRPRKAKGLLMHRHTL